MNRIIDAFSQHPFVVIAVLAAVLVAMIAPLPIKKRYDWDSVRLLLSMSQRFEYAAVVYLPVIAAALLAFYNIPLIVTGLMPLIASNWAIYLLFPATSGVIYLRRIQETWALNRVCDRAFDAQ